MNSRSRLSTGRGFSSKQIPTAGMSSLCAFKLPNIGVVLLPLSSPRYSRHRLGGPRTSNLRASSVPEGAKSISVEQRDNNIFVLGMGFVGQFLACQLKEEGWRVSGTCTNEGEKKRLEESGFETFIYNIEDHISPISPSYTLSQGKNLDALQDATHLLVSIPPIGLRDSVLHLHEDLILHKLSSGNIRWLCYLSSTSVYGDHGGSWVDEGVLPKPENQLAVARLNAENAWLNLGSRLGVHAYVFRLGGIYGPHRSALDTIIKQRPLSKVQEERQHRHYTARIHVDDICQAIIASIKQPPSRKIFNIVDDDPAPRSEVFSFACSLIKKKCPEKFEGRFTSHDSEIPHPHGGGHSAGKRVSNALMKSELGINLLHPTYRSGLECIVQSMRL